MTIIVKGGLVEFVMDSRPLVLPKSYVMVHDTDGASLDKTSLFFGPAELTDEAITEVPPEAKWYFGDSYQARVAILDIPDGQWDLVGQVTEITYFRPGKLESDWRHEFYEKQPLYKQEHWYWLRLPENAIIDHRGIVRP